VGITAANQEYIELKLQCLNLIKGDRVAETVARRRETQHLSNRIGGKEEAE
jgi:hypothetical protein